MRSAAALSVADPAAAMPGARLLGLAQRMMRTGMAMARCVNRIARQHLAGEDVRRLAPPGFNPTLANALIVQAVSWTAALRERLRALAAPARFVPDAPQAERGPRERGAVFRLPEGAPATAEDDWHDWRELARPWRIGPGGVAVAMRAIAGLSDQQVVTQVCGNLGRAAAELGAEADVARIAALEAAARALCPEAEAPPDESTQDATTGTGAVAGEAPGLLAAWPPPDPPPAGPSRGPPPD